MNKSQLRGLIDNTLTEIGLYSVDASNLLMGTCAVESALGRYIRQINGPALGIFQMEAPTFKDNYNWVFKYKKDLFEKICIASNVISDNNPEILVYNLKFAICFARVHYYRRPEALPTTINGYADQWKRFYNTRLGKGTVEKFIEAYEEYVL